MSGETGLTAGAVARRLGIAVTTLRSWDQRYRLGPHRQRSGQHRRYDADDLARLTAMKTLTSDGVPAAQAAAWVLEHSASAPSPSPSPSVEQPGSASVRGLTRAALRLDVTQMRRLIVAALHRGGVVATWAELIAPTLAEIGRRHAATGGLVDVEHLLSATVSAALTTVSLPETPPQVLLACADEEQHTLALEALVAALAEHGIGARMLGARVPSPALLQAIRRTGPDVVAIWSQQSSTARLEALQALRAARPRPKVLLAIGPGWHQLPLPSGIGAPATLAAAVELVAGGPAPSPDA